MSQTIITEIKDQSKTYRIGRTAKQVLHDINYKHTQYTWRKLNFIRKLNKYTNHKGGFLPHTNKSYLF